MPESLQTPAEIAPSLRKSYGGVIAPGTEVILVDNGVMVVVKVKTVKENGGSGEVIDVSPLTAKTHKTDLEEGDPCTFREEHVHGIRTETTE